MRQRGIKRSTIGRGRGAQPAVLTAEEYRQWIQALVDQARADLLIAERLAAEARQRFGADISVSGDDE